MATLKTLLIDSAPLPWQFTKSLDDFYFRLSAHREISKRQLHRKTPLLLLTMGKVGSSTAWRNLQQKHLVDKYAVCRSHFLSSNGSRFFRETIENGYGSRRRLPDKAKRMVASNDALGRRIRRKRFSGRIKVITIIRDPIATNISGFFQNYFWWPQSVLHGYRSGTMTSMEPLHRLFLEQYPHEFPLKWFDYELRRLVSLENSQFPHAKGYQIFAGPSADVLVLRLENLNEVINRALLDFLGVATKTPDAANRAAQKWYSDTYKEFLATIRLPDSYLQTIYSHECVRYFYSDAEISAFKLRWGAKNGHLNC